MIVISLNKALVDGSFDHTVFGATVQCTNMQINGLIDQLIDRMMLFSSICCT